VISIAEPRAKNICGRSSVKKCLVDAGPLVALFDRSERQHARVKAVLAKQRFVLHTTWLVVCEVGHLLSFDVRAQADFLDWIAAGGLIVVDLLADDVVELSALTKKYHDLPMDFADGSLIILANRLDERKILTFDSDFYVYRAAGKAFHFVATIRT
jgi:predicted nucleic acid-binding protein